MCSLGIVNIGGFSLLSQPDNRSHIVSFPFLGHLNKLVTATGQEFRIYSYNRFGRGTGYAVDLDNGH